jgi:hypothetical protein
LAFWRNFWRRGAHVNTPKIGSRGDVKCSGGIYGFRADLRRESDRGNLDLTVFWFLLVGPRGPTEEGGHYCVFLGGEFNCVGVWRTAVCA